MTNMSNDVLDNLRRPLLDGMDEIWDADDSMARDYTLGLAPGRFVTAFHETDSEALSWLVFFVARRALPCWDYCFGDDRAQQRVLALGRYLIFGDTPDWSQLETAIKSPYYDCRQCDTQSASDSAAEAARYIHQQDPIQALYCISSADCAYDHVLTEDCFRAWLVDVAVPIAFEKREMSADEMECMRESTHVEPLIIDRGPARG